MKFIILPFLFAACLAAPEANFNLAGDKYDFNFATGDSGSHARSETGTGSGAVQGKYSYVDPNGNLREVRYTADASGFHPEGDISVDKKTAQEAAALAALAPKAPEPVQVQTYAAGVPAVQAVHTPFAYSAGHPFFYGAVAHHPFAHTGNYYYNRFF